MPTEIFNTSVVEYITGKCKEANKTLTKIDSIDNPSKITTNNVNIIMDKIKEENIPNSVILMSFLSYTDNFYNCFENTTPQVDHIFSEVAIYPNFTNNNSKIYFNNKLYVCSTSKANLSVSYLWQIGSQKLGIDNYGFNVLNILNMAYNSIKNNILVDLPSHNDGFILDPIYKNTTNNSIAILKYTNNNYLPNYLYYSSENIKFKATIPDYKDNIIKFESIPGVIAEPKKAVALLELTNGAYENDNGILRTLYYYLTKTNIFIDMKIYNTNGDKDTTLRLLEECYQEGIRIFLGFSRSTMFSFVLEWFNLHNDAIGVSLSSSANSLAIPKNMYRLQIVDSYMLDSITVPLNDSIQNQGKIFYIYSKYELAAQEVLSQLINTYTEKNIISYAVYSDNLTHELVSDFYSINNITENDSVIVYIIENIDRQTYVNLFNTLYIPAKQYDILAFGYPEIDSSITNLNDLYYLLIIENITSCELWDQGFKEIQSKDFQTNTLNGMHLITQLSKNLNKYSLASYNSCLQFNENNDIKYGGITSYLYNKTSGFVKKNVYTNDPIYGQVTFETY
jgi:hypothetical protein